MAEAPPATVEWIAILLGFATVAIAVVIFFIRLENRQQRNAEQVQAGQSKIIELLTNLTTESGQRLESSNQISAAVEKLAGAINHLESTVDNRGKQSSREHDALMQAVTKVVDRMEVDHRDQGDRMGKMYDKVEDVKDAVAELHKDLAAHSAEERRGT